MEKFKIEGKKIREYAKSLVIDFMKNHFDCKPKGKGLKQSQIFRMCGLDWGNYENATSSNQQYWIVALLRELEMENKVERDSFSKHWRLK